MIPPLFCGEDGWALLACGFGTLMRAFLTRDSPLAPTQKNAAEFAAFLLLTILNCYTLFDGLHRCD